MAILNIPGNGKAIKGRKKTAPRVDLTAMVDLMFLLTTFFMLTTTLSELNAADVTKPVPIEEFIPYPETRTMTVLLVKNNQIVSYLGQANRNHLKVESMADLRQLIEANKTAVAQKYNHDPRKSLIVIIKPTQNSIYKNFVDALDELKIAGVKSYSIDDAHLSAEENDILKKYSL